MNVLDYLIDSVKYRAYQIKSEIELLQNQLNFSSYCNSQDHLKQLQFKLSLRTELYSVYTTYLNGFIDTYDKISPFKKAMQLHFYSLQIGQTFFQLSMDQIDEKQHMFRKSSNYLGLNECDQTIDDLLKTMDLFFPYKNFFLLLKDNSNIFPEMIKICLCYDPSTPNKSLKSLFSLLKKEKCNTKLGCGDLVIEMIAHMFLSIFTHRINIKDAVDPISNYNFQQNCANLVEDNLKGIEINPSLISLIENNIGYSNVPVPKEVDTILLNDVIDQPKNTPKGSLTPDLKLIKARSSQINPNHIASSASGEKNSFLFSPFFLPTEKTEVHRYKSPSYRICSNPNSHKLYDRTIDFPKLYENDPNSPYQCLHFITLEMRQMIIQPCVALSYNILNRVTMMINQVLFDKDRSVGSDESFPFFVAVLADARFFLFTSLLTRMNTLMPTDFLSSRFVFLQKKLQIAHDFIISRVVKVPPFVLLPFDSIEHISGIKRVHKTDLNSNKNDDYKVAIDSFLVYVYPKYMNTAFPSIVQYTGDNRNISILYKYEFDTTNATTTSSFGQITSNWTIIPTKYGTIMHYPAKESEIKSLIHIGSNVEYCTVSDIINEISNMMFMCQFPLSMKPIFLSKFDEIKQEFMKTWNIHINWTDKYPSLSIVKKIQTILIEKYFLPKNHEVDGIIDIETANSIKRAINTNEMVYLTPKVYTFFKAQ